MTTPAGPSSAQLPRPGDVIAGKYVLDRLLGQGGMGAVFAARHVKLSKPVAIKIMLADTSNPEASARFINEGRAAANIQNEHVVRVDDVDEEMGYAYMVLELLEGEDLSQVLEREPQKRLPPHVAVDYVLQALRGVIQAHAIGIVHRDLKPSNLFLAKRKDGSVVVKVLDFGISKQQNASGLAASPSALTSTKAMLGSPLYMSPEQLRSSKSVDQRADIWAFGVILYELITGSLPFMGESLGELFAAILETDPMPLSQRVEGVPPGLEQIVLRCLARRPENRFQTASELAAALAPYAVAGAGATGVVGAPSQPHNVAPSNPVIESHMSPPGMMLASSPAQTGPQPRPVGGTVALGAVTPQNLHQTNGGWQSTGGASGAVVPKTKAPLVIGLVAALLAVTGVIGGVFIYLAKRPASPDPSTASSAGVSATPPPTPTIISSAPTPSTAPSPSETAPAASSSATAATPATAAPTTTAAATTTVAATTAKTTPTTRPTQGGHHPPPTPTTTTATTTTTKPVETKPPQPKPPRTADPTQTTR